MGVVEGPEKNGSRTKGGAAMTTDELDRLAELEATAHAAIKLKTAVEKLRRWDFPDNEQNLWDELQEALAAFPKDTTSPARAEG